MGIKDVRTRPVVMDIPARPIQNSNTVLFINDIQSNDGLLSVGIASSKFDGFFAPSMPFPSLLEEKHLFANDFTKQAKYLFGVNSGPFLLKAIYEIQQFITSYQDDELVKENKQNEKDGQHTQQDEQEEEPKKQSNENSLSSEDIKANKQKSKHKQIMIKAMLQLQQEMYLRELIYQHIQRGYTANSMS